MKRLTVMATLALAAALGIVLILSARGATAQDGVETPTGGGVQYTYSGDVNAPDFPTGAEWINVSTPITMAELRGKIVLLDFWTYG